MNDLNWSVLKDEIEMIYADRLEVLRVGSYEDDGLTLFTKEDGELDAWKRQALSIERRVFEFGHVSYTLTLLDRKRDLIQTLPITDMSEVIARFTVEMAVSCLFGIDDHEDMYLVDEDEA